MDKKIIYQLSAGILGALVFGTGGFLFLMNYGGNNCDQPPALTCECFCCNLFDSRGYESCSQLGLYVGLLVGILIGPLLLRIIRKKFLQYDKNK